MGLLDEAIRQHLDLKRRRGADPAEIEEAEREALGPTRRAPEETDQVAFDQELAGAPDHELAVSPDYKPDAGSELEAARGQEDWIEPFDPASPGRESSYQEPFDQEASDQATEIISPEEKERLEDPLDHLDAPAGLAPDPASAPPAPEPAEPPEQMVPPASQEAPADDHLGQETEEYDVELEAEGEEKGEDEGMLEETPEFLQDTPEHDRLWFEQRPPRDFDFDG